MNKESNNMASKRLTVQQRKEIFQNVVTIQDANAMSVSDSYRHVAEHFEVTEAQVRQIAQEGIDKQWPPLDTEEVAAE
jgi:hypothetical protein